ncbi:hypothetical protein HBI23_105320 [Parastagonospora nodorum]|nr:hypothetical protein HBI23_105320 [Parastagonospora nodorum]
MLAWQQPMAAMWGYRYLHESPSLSLLSCWWKCISERHVRLKFALIAGVTLKLARASDCKGCCPGEALFHNTWEARAT